MTQNNPTGSCPRSLNPSNKREAPQNIFDGDKISSAFPPKIAAENTSPYFQHSGFQEDKSLSFRDENSSFQEYQSNFQGDQPNFQGDEQNFHGDQSSFQKNQPSIQDGPLMFHEGRPSFQDTQSSFQEDQPTIQGNFNGVSSDDEESPHKSATFLLSEKLGSIASELRDEVMTIQPSIQKQEAEDKSIITSAQQILRDAIEYRENLDALKERYAARLGQVSNALALKKSNS